MTTDEIVRQLDARGERWDFYRLYTGGWAIQLGDRNDPAVQRTVSANTIEGALAAALSSKPIPTIPPRPQPFYPDDWVAEKQGSGWTAQPRPYNTQRSAFGKRPTRKAVLADLERLAEIRNREIANWDSQHAELTRTGTEGVDYLWGK